MDLSFEPRQIVRRDKSALFRIFDPRMCVRSFCVQRLFVARVALARSVCDYFYHACIERHRVEIKCKKKKQKKTVQLVYTSVIGSDNIFLNIHRCIVRETVWSFDVLDCINFSFLVDEIFFACKKSCLIPAITCIVLIANWIYL